MKKERFGFRNASHFGIRQICDLLMLGGAIVLLVGIFVSNIVIAVGLGIYIVATLLSSAILLFSQNTVLRFVLKKALPKTKAPLCYTNF